MKNRLKIRLFQALLLVCAVFFLACVAQADPSHHQHGTIASPFDKGIEKPLHCILNMHLHDQKAFCPHQGQNGKAEEFRPDCGPHSGSANSSSLSKELSKKITAYGLAPFLVSEQISPLKIFERKILPRSIDHPPQLT